MAIHTMQERITELRERTSKAMLGGGEDRLEKQHKGGKLTVANSTVSGNTSISGGGIYNDGDAEIVRSTLESNYSYFHGGSIYSFGKLVVRETTISGSSTGLDGAGIHAAGDVLIDSSTFPMLASCFSSV